MVMFFMVIFFMFLMYNFWKIPNVIYTSEPICFKLVCSRIINVNYNDAIINLEINHILVKECYNSFYSKFYTSETFLRSELIEKNKFLPDCSTSLRARSGCIRCTSEYFAKYFHPHPSFAPGRTESGRFI